MANSAANPGGWATVAASGSASASSGSAGKGKGGGKGQGGHKRPGVTEYKYRLCSWICHLGEEANSGHYTAFTRYNEDWTKYDDASKSPIMDLQYAMKNSYSTAYIFMYELLTIDGERAPNVYIRP